MRAATPPHRQRGSPRAIALLIALALVAVALAVAGCGSDSSSDSGGGSKEATSTKTTAAAPAVPGQFSKDCGFTAGDESGCKALTASKVSCQWSGDQVEMSITFMNSLNAHVTVHVEPKYTLLNAGDHGTGITNYKDIGVDAGATRMWKEGLGSPSGVSGQPKITACSPELSVLGVELG